MAPKVTVKDRGYDALMKRLVAAAHKPAVVTVGIHEEEGSGPEGDSGATVAEVAAYAELGLGQQQRSFVRSYVDRNEAELQDGMRKVGQALVTGEVASLDQALGSFGQKAAAGMRAQITDGDEPTDKPETVERKGSSTPLVETGNLVSKITSKVAGK